MCLLESNHKESDVIDGWFQNVLGVVLGEDAKQNRQIETQAIGNILR